MVYVRSLEELKENITALPEGLLVHDGPLEDATPAIMHADDPDEESLCHLLEKLASHRDRQTRTDILSQITARFADAERYRNDMRYLRVWLEYASLSPDPVYVFKWMIQKGIGSCRALFYEEYSALLELRKSLDKAEAVLEAGMRAGALPVARLKMRLDDLRARIAAQAGNNTIGLGPVGGPPGVERQPGPADGRSEIQPGSGLKRLRVFTDDQSDQDAQDPLYVQPDQPFPTLPQHDENKQQASRWVGQTIVQNDLHRAETRSPRIEVFNDTDTEHVMVFLDAVWPQGPEGDEISYEENMLIQRDLLEKDLPRSYETTEIQKEVKEDRTERLSSVLRQYHYGNAHLGYTEKIAPPRPPEPTEIIPRIPLQPPTSTQPPQPPQPPPLWPPPRHDSTWSNSSRSLSSVSSASIETQQSGPPTPGGPGTPGKRSLRLSPQLHNLLVSRSSSDASTQARVEIEDNGYPPGPPGPPCDASLPEVRRKLLPRVLRSLQAIPLFVHSPMPLPLGEMKPGNIIELSQFAAQLKLQLGDGNYGVVWKVRLEQGKMYALKAERSAIPWEFYLISAARSRLHDPRILDSIVSIYHYEGYAQIQFMLMALMGYGNLLDVSNVIHHGRFSNDRAHEQLAMFYIVELMRTVENLHQVGIIHGDIKPENIMIRVGFDPSSRRLRGEFQPGGDRGWRDHGICLVDFGRGIDTHLFPRGQQYLATWDPDPEQDCWQIVHNKPWSYETDYHGIAAVAHVLLFGPRLVVRQKPEGFEPVPTSTRRQPRHPVWHKIFRKMLNPGPPSEMISTMSSLRHEMETFLEDPPLEEGNLRSLYAAVANHLRARKT